MGDDSIDVATTLNNIGIVYNRKGDYQQALENYTKSLKIKTKISRDDSIDVAMTFNNIGNVCRNKGDN